MTTADQFFREGKLDEAVEASLTLVKNSPTDLNARFKLAEYSCIAGNIERADRQFDTLSQQDSSLSIRIAMLRQLIRAEQTRTECFEKSRPPEFLGNPDQALRLSLKALIASREQDHEAAAGYLESARNVDRSNIQWIVNSTMASDLRDYDDLLAEVLEVFTPNGKYFWVGWSQILVLELHPPQRPLDLLWRRATLTIQDGPDGEVFLPAIYHAAADSDVQPADRLGHQTRWFDSGGGIVRGIGQRTLLVGQDELPFMELSNIQRAGD